MDWQGKKVLVTGAGGFIGSHLVESLLRAGATTRVLVHYNAFGSVGWLAIRLPDGREFSQFVLAMDTGAAIRGPGRIDLFLGPGDEAERVAGELRVRGEVTWFGPPRS